MRNLKIVLLGLGLVIFSGCEKQSIQTLSKFSIESICGTVLGYSDTKCVYDNGCKKYYELNGEFKGKICGTFNNRKTDFEITPK